MNFRQLVTRNVMRNSRLYASYFFSSVFSIMVFFIFSLIFFHPNYSVSLSASSETIAFLSTTSLRVAQILVVVMSFVFLWYAFAVFLKGRKYDFSVYLIVGMTKGDLRRMVFSEGMIIAGAALVTGMTLGTLFAKLVLLISQNALALNQDLPFYLPIKPVLLTTFVYLGLFIVLFFITTLRLENEELIELNKSEVTPLNPPRANWYLAVLGLLLTIMGYACVLYFTRLVNRNFDVFYSAIFLLSLGVLLTVAGTYLLYRQTSILIVIFLQKMPNFYKGSRMLFLGSLSYRLKQNAAMYFMITTVAAVALVSVGVTMTLGSSEFGQTLNTSFAYIYNGFDSTPVHRKRVAAIEKSIRQAGYQELTQEILPLFIEAQDVEKNFYFAIPASTFNEMAEFTSQKKLFPKNKQTIRLANSNKEVSEIRRFKLDQKEEKIIFNVSEDKKNVPASYTYSTARYDIGNGSTLVVSDAFYQEIYEEKLLERESSEVENPLVATQYVVHFLEWAENPKLANKITASLNKESTRHQKKEDLFYDSIKNIPEEKLTEEQLREEKQLSAENFYYYSLYETWHEGKQANGMILFLSVLIGSVFFSFAACIIYFRLFGELEQDSAYHYSLSILGVSQKTRQRLVTKDMLLMYFIPVAVAIIHFSVAIYAFGLLTNLLVWNYFIKVSGVYIVFQLLFFLISRWRYLIHLERKVMTQR